LPYRAAQQAARQARKAQVTTATSP
jgi:hypothetical protein